MATTLFSSIVTGKVDAMAGIITGVSVITLGEAKGHGLFIDEPALEQILRLANEKADGVKVKADHGSGIFAVVGKLVNFRRDGVQIRADLELFKSDDNYEKVIEMATKLPEAWGLSVSTTAKSVTIDGKKMVRFNELESVDLVDAPAANPNGLFSQNNNNKQSMKTFAVKLGLPETATESEIMAKLDELELAKKALSEKEEKEKEEKEKMSKKLEEDKKEKEEKELSAVKALEARLAAIESKALETVQLSEKQAKISAIEGLVAEASKEGKVIPLSNDELLALSIDSIKAMFNKLPKGQLKLSKTPETNKPSTPLKGEALVNFCLSKKAEGALQLNEVFASISKQN